VPIRSQHVRPMDLTVLTCFLIGYIVCDYRVYAVQRTLEGMDTMAGYFGPIEKQTLENSFFRKVLFTGEHSQLVVMCLPVGEEIGNEMHPDVDQFFRIEQGEAKFVIEGNEEHVAGDGDAFVVPAGTYHNVVNASDSELKLYTIYSPQNHPDGTVHKTKAEAEAAEALEHH